MISERDFPSRAARASIAAISSTVRRSATTCDGSAPRPGRPRPRFFSASTSRLASASAVQAAICSSVTGVPLIGLALGHVNKTKIATKQDDIVDIIGGLKWHSC